MNLKPYSAAIFDGWWRWLLRNMPLEGLNCMLDRGDYGTIIGCDESFVSKHPWWITPRLKEDEDKMRWVLSFEPAFVNGQDVQIFDQSLGAFAPLTAEQRPEIHTAWRDALRAGGGLTSNDLGEITSTGEEVTTSPGKGYPRYFKNFGLKQPAPRGSDPAQDELATRELRACDIALIVPRIGTIQNISFGDFILGGQIVQISTSLNTSAFDAYRDRPYQLGAFSRWAAPAEPTYLDRLLGQTVEPTTDEIRIATVWAVSPPDATANDEPGEGWTLYPEYNCFFNLMHISRNQLPTVPPRPITFVTPLLGGAANVLIASFLDPINDAYNAISEMFTQATFRGSFYSI